VRRCLGERSPENLDIALQNAHIAAVLAGFVLPRIDGDIALDVDHCALWYVEEKIAARAFLCKGGDLEPAGDAVIARARVAGDGVADDIMAGRRGLELGRVGEVADDRDAG